MQERESDMGGPRFSPPLYKQRYEAVVKACRQLKAAKAGSLHDHAASQVNHVFTLRMLYDRWWT